MASVLLLGASSDMAVALARAYAKQKFDIMLAGRDTETLQALRSDIEIRYQVRADTLFFNATDFSSHRLFYQNLPTVPDITICVFGYLGDQEKALDDWEEAERIIQTNYTGAVSILNIVASDYSKRRSGIIIGISSVAGERGRQSNFMYGSAKAGFTAYLSGLRNRVYRDGVRVITVLPGFVYTRMTAELTLPPLLTATPDQVAAGILKAVSRNRNVIYIKWFWRWIMLIIKIIPENKFKKMKL